MKKSELMAEVKIESMDIYEKTCDSGTKIVWGEGNLDSPVVMVGEAPGASEDRVGRPFVGAAGNLLNKELCLAGFTRESVYITNVVKCRPTRTENSRKVNRQPNSAEISAWREILLREIEVISPKYIVCLGAIAASVLIHPDFRIKTERGKWFNGVFDTRVIATYHTAYLLRARQYGDMESLYQFREDLKEISKAITA